MKKKIIAATMAAAMCVSLAACGGSTASSSAAESTASSTAESTASSTADAASTGDEEVDLRMAWWGSQDRHDRTIKAIELFTNMIAEGSCPDLATVSETAPNELLCAGKVAMSINGSWMLAGYRDNEYAAANCDVAVLPFTNDPSDRVSIYNGLGWAAAANGVPHRVPGFQGSTAEAG